MAMQGNVTTINQKVSRLLSKHQKKPVLKPNKPLSLKDQVANRRMKTGAATCVTEISVMMACWKQKNFVDALCSNEMQAFYTCVEKAQADRKNQSGQTNLQGRLFSPKQATTLLKRYPNPRTEI